MSRTNSAPNSPVIGTARLNSPKINRSFRVSRYISVNSISIFQSFTNLGRKGSRDWRTDKPS